MSIANLIPNATGKYLVRLVFNQVIMYFQVKEGTVEESLSLLPSALLALGDWHQAVDDYMYFEPIKKQQWLPTEKLLLQYRKQHHL